jgi:hypothetical protein
MLPVTWHERDPWQECQVSFWSSCTVVCFSLLWQRFSQPRYSDILRYPIFLARSSIFGIDGIVKNQWFLELWQLNWCIVVLFSIFYCEISWSFVFSSDCKQNGILCGKLWTRVENRCHGKEIPIELVYSQWAVAIGGNEDIICQTFEISTSVLKLALQVH